jgi:hypothetical protein
LVRTCLDVFKGPSSRVSSSMVWWSVVRVPGSGLVFVYLQQKSLSTLLCAISVHYHYPAPYSNEDNSVSDLQMCAASISHAALMRLREETLGIPICHPDSTVMNTPQPCPIRPKRSFENVDQLPSAVSYAQVYPAGTSDTCVAWAARYLPSLDCSAAMQGKVERMDLAYQ